MPSGKKKIFSASFKKQVALEAVKAVKTIAQICSEYKVLPARVHEWKKQLIANCDQIFENAKSNKQDSKLVEKECQIEQLQRKVGELVIENDFYKKKLNN